MSEQILKALMQLFAIIGKQDEGVDARALSPRTSARRAMPASASASAPRTEMLAYI